MFPIQKVYSGDITTTSMFIKNFAERFKYHQQSGENSNNDLRAKEIRFSEHWPPLYEKKIWGMD